MINSAIGGAEGPDRVFVGGLPYYFTETQIRELLESFGYELKILAILQSSLTAFLPEFYCANASVLCFIDQSILVIIHVINYGIPILKDTLDLL